MNKNTLKTKNCSTLVCVSFGGKGETYLELCKTSRARSACFPQKWPIKLKGEGIVVEDNVENVNQTQILKYTG